MNFSRNIWFVEKSTNLNSTDDTMWRILKKRRISSRITKRSLNASTSISFNIIDDHAYLSISLHCHFIVTSLSLHCHFTVTSLSLHCCVVLLRNVFEFFIVKWRNLEIKLITKNCMITNNVYNDIQTTSFIKLLFQSHFVLKSI